jgi:hypothetical protein
MSGACSGQSSLVPGEGAAMMMLESTAHAKRRGAKPLAIVRGMAFSTFTENQTDSNSCLPLFRQTIEMALKNTGIEPRKIDAICCNSHDSDQLTAIESLCGPVEGRLIDVSKAIGAPGSSIPLCNLSYMLAESAVEPDGKTKYILSSCLSPQGTASVIIFEFLSD